jgi:hypothetical protein
MQMKSSQHRAREAEHTTGTPGRQHPREAVVPVVDRQCPVVAADKGHDVAVAYVDGEEALALQEEIDDVGYVRVYEREDGGLLWHPLRLVACRQDVHEPQPAGAHPHEAVPLDLFPPLRPVIKREQLGQLHVVRAACRPAPPPHLGRRLHDCSGVHEPRRPLGRTNRQQIRVSFRKKTVLSGKV